ncbi:MAG TPA: DPP IV N-terminal domain-containing protein [Steroidobacteraceae bacterium]|nr:DPP IV N-terminal domain-containing protein [Steroidobacteraceae bacterium]
MKRPGYLELGRRKAFGRPVRKPVGPVAPPPDPQAVPDFDLATWRVRPALGRMTRADRIIALDRPTLLVLLILAERPPGGVNRDELAARVFGPGGVEQQEPKLRRCLGFLRRAFSEDGAVRLTNAPGDAYLLEVGDPVPGRGPKAVEFHGLRDEPGAVEAWARRAKRHWLAIGLATLVVVALATGLIALIDRGHVVTFGTVAHVAPFAAEPGDKRNPSFSPDGRQVVYSWRGADDTGAHLVTRPVAGGSWRPLTAGAGSDEFPAWSPSGTRIAFERIAAADCAVFVIVPDGSDERRVGDCNFGAAGPVTWTRDGGALIYSHRADAVRSRQLVSLDINTLRLAGVTNPVVGMPGDTQPVLSPSGRRLAFVRSHAIGVADLSLLESGGVAVEKVTRDGWPLAGAAWDGGSFSVVFASPRGGRLALWRSRLDGRPPELLLATPNELRSPAISNDGRELAFEEWQLTTRLVRAPADGTSALADERPGGIALERQPQLSPDGRELVFVSNSSGRDQLWIGSPTGGEPRILTHADLDYLESPRWSPDGRVIAFAGARAGRFDLWAVTVADGRLERLSDDGASRAPSFSRDGRWLYYATAGSGMWQVWRRGWPEAGAAEALTTEGGFAALESRDGDALYYVRPDRRGLWRRNREPGGDETLVTADFGPADWCDWEVTADSVWFVTRADGGPAELARYSIADDRVSRVRTLPGLLPGSGMTAAPDGALLMFMVASARSDLKLATLE